ncbi:ATP-binding protein [Nocardiopsis sp. ARC36]
MITGTVLQVTGDVGSVVFEAVRRRTRSSYQKPKAVAETFVPADRVGFDRLCDSVSSGTDRCGVLVGRPGSGRTSAALTVLHRARRSVRLLLVDQQGDKDDNPFEGVRHERGQGYLVDISELGDLTEDFLGNLVDFAATAAATKSVLVVVADAVQWAADLVPGAPHLLVEPPPPASVLKAHLTRLLKDEEAARMWSEHDAVTQLLRGLSLEEVVAFAQTVRDDSINPASDMHTQVKRVREAFLGKGRDVGDWFQANKDDEGVWNRIVITALALLEGQPVRRVLHGARDLAKALKVPPQDAGGIRGAGTEATLEAVDAFRDADGAAYFRKDGFGARVLDHLWRNHEGVRGELLTWATVQAERNEGELAGSIARRLWKLFEHRRETDEVVKVFNDWAVVPHLRTSAVALGAGAATHPGFGQRMRRRFYEIARKPSSREAAAAVARACALYGASDDLSDYTNAMTRLKWLSSSADGVVREEAFAALRSLAERPGFRLCLAYDVLGWIGEGVSPDFRSTVHRFFAHLLTVTEESVPVLLEHHLYREDENEEHITAAMWHELFDRGSPEVIARALEPWVDAALTDEVLLAKVTFLLGCAVAGLEGDDPGAVARRTVLAGRLIDRVCVELGLELDQPALYRLHMDLRFAGAAQEEARGEPSDKLRAGRVDGEGPYTAFQEQAPFPAKHPCSMSRCCRRRRKRPRGRAIGWL